MRSRTAAFVDSMETEVPGAVGPVGGHKEDRKATSAEAQVEAWMRQALEATSLPQCRAFANHAAAAAPVQPPPRESSGDEAAPVPIVGMARRSFAEPTQRAGSGRRPLLRGSSAAAAPGLRCRGGGSLIPRLLWSTKRTATHVFNSMLNENIRDYDEMWFGQQLLRLQTDGMACKKVARNGTASLRSVHLSSDARSASIEIRGGRGGPKALLLDELTDIRRGLGSMELKHFCQKVQKESPQGDLADCAVVLQSPQRTFSLILPSTDLRDTLAHCILFLLEPPLPR